MFSIGSFLDANGDPQGCLRVYLPLIFQGRIMWTRQLTLIVFFNPKFATVNMLKARSPVRLPSVYKKLAGDWFDCVSSTNDALVQRLTDQLLRFYPVGGRDEICNSTTCHRSELVFGRFVRALCSPKYLCSIRNLTIAEN